MTQIKNYLQLQRSQEHLFGHKWKELFYVKKQRALTASPLPIVETSNDNRVPQRIHLAAAVVHHSGQPGVDGLWTVAVTITKQLLINPDRKTTIFLYIHT